MALSRAKHSRARRKRLHCRPTLPEIHDCPAPSSSCYLTAAVLPFTPKTPVKPSVLKERILTKYVPNLLENVNRLKLCVAFVNPKSVELQPVVNTVKRRTSFNPIKNHSNSSVKP